MDSRTQTPPRSPFSTPLSGSAREAELRIRIIFQWKKRRPPAWLIALAALRPFCAVPWCPAKHGPPLLL